MNHKIKIEGFYMITLESSERFKLHYENDDFLRKNIKKFKAIDSKRNPIDTCNKYNYNIKINEYENHFKKCSGAFGCSLSHFSLYEIIKNHQTNNYYCVLEDDVEPASLKKFMKSDEYIMPNTPIINLIGGANGGINSTAGYLINPAGAELLLKDSNNEITLPHDKYMFKYICEKYKGTVSFSNKLTVIKNIKRDLI